MLKNTVGKNRPVIGVAVILRKGNRVLIGKRKSAHGEGNWGFPGGHLKYRETLETCARRELFEETGLMVEMLSPGPYTEDFFDSGKHYITIFVIARYVSGEPETHEPDKVERWEWHEWNRLPTPLFLPITNLLAQGYTLERLQKYYQ